MDQENITADSPADTSVEIEDDSISSSEPSLAMDESLLRLHHRMRNNLGDSINGQCVPYNPICTLQVRERRRRQREDPKVGNTNWCKCGNCIPMPTARESVCCKDITNLQQHFSDDVQCITHVQEMLDHCVEKRYLEFTIRNARMATQIEMNNHYNRVMRRGAYRAFTIWTHGFLGQKNRIVIPACFVNLIRLTYRDPAGIYVGFKQAEDNPALKMALD
ncbi:P2X purinoceptor 7 [Xenopus laevis]|uniref:P2X purinoceptor 7 n=2 Tax=Xenopus laevis TaxID=8355 RepID=A0A1L8GWC2_XENLA|nr:P2X purinoceptor 7 [Xenopus laevis]XP_018107414.1 P2X purinoceptor 7 [Xenopus laevis]OCT88142.1 hypothetical protein XELAEV_18016775mg [Xenopus laevis]